MQSVLFSIMKKLSLEDTQSLVSSFVKSFGQSGAAQKLTEKGYRSPEGSQILQAHIFRILHGSGTCLLSPETEDQQQEPPTTKEPIAVPKRAKQVASELFTDEAMLQQEIAQVAAELGQELIEEQHAIEELERSMPPLVPLTDRPHRTHRHIEQDIRVSAVFNRRQPVEFKTDDEGHEKSYFGIPCMHHSPTTTCRPHQTRQYGRNTLSTTDLHVRQR